jgi:hypothetical protein
MATSAMIAAIRMTVRILLMGACGCLAKGQQQRSGNSQTNRRHSQQRRGKLVQRTQELRKLNKN